MNYIANIKFEQLIKNIIDKKLKRILCLYEYILTNKTLQKNTYSTTNLNKFDFDKKNSILKFYYSKFYINTKN